MINTGIPEDAETTRYRFEGLRPILLSAEQQPYQMAIQRHGQPP
jgi:hypothetical protein